MEPFGWALCPKRDACFFLPCIFILKDARADAGIKRIVGKGGQLFRGGDAAYIRFNASAPAKGTCRELDVTKYKAISRRMW